MFVCVWQRREKKRIIIYRRRSEDKPHKQRQKCTQFIVLFIYIKQQNNRIRAHLPRSFSLHHFNCARPHGLSFLSSNNRRHTKYIQLLKCFICSLFTFFFFHQIEIPQHIIFSFFRKESSPNLCIGSVSQTYKFVCFIYSFSFFFMCALLFFFVCCWFCFVHHWDFNQLGFDVQVLLLPFFPSVQFVFSYLIWIVTKRETRC